MREVGGKLYNIQNSKIITALTASDKNNFYNATKINNEPHLPITRMFWEYQTYANVARVDQFATAKT